MGVTVVLDDWFEDVKPVLFETLKKREGSRQESRRWLHNAIANEPLSSDS